MDHNITWAWASLRRCDREEVLRAESGMRRMLTNPFKSAIPLIGDYDISVLLEALRSRQCRVSLHAVFNPKVSRSGRVRCLPYIYIYIYIIYIYNIYIYIALVPGR